MVQTLGTIGSLFLTAGAMWVIVGSIVEEWSAVRLALQSAGRPRTDALPPHTRRVAGPRRARFVRIRPEALPQRVAA